MSLQAKRSNLVKINPFFPMGLPRPPAMTPNKKDCYASEAHNDNGKAFIALISETFSKANANSDGLSLLPKLEAQSHLARIPASVKSRYLLGNKVTQTGSDKNIRCPVLILMNSGESDQGSKSVSRGIHISLLGLLSDRRGHSKSRRGMTRGKRIIP
jgi:hypothetical protein